MYREAIARTSYQSQMEMMKRQMDARTKYVDSMERIRIQDLYKERIAALERRIA